MQITNFFDGLIEQHRPTIERTGHTVRSYAERIISRLDAIHDAIANDEWQEDRVVHTYTIGVGEKFELTVPMSTQWEVERFRVRAINGNTTARVRVNGSWVGGFSTGDGTQGAAVPTDNLILRGGDVLSFTEAGAAEGCEVHMQVKVKRPAQARRRAAASGFGPDPITDDSETRASHTPERHTIPITQVPYR